MDVAVIGGRGFVGEAVVDALEEHEITTVDPEIGGAGHISADITIRDSIVGALEGFEAVVNLAGLSPMRQPRGTSYRAVHVDGAANIVAACEEHGIERLVHMSALGADPDGRTAYLRTKGEGERAVRDSDLDATVMRPSVIYGRGNELVAMAERWAPTRLFPRLTAQIQPVHRGDVAELFRMAVDGEIGDETVEIGGPDRMPVHVFAAKVYNAKGYRCVRLPVQPLLRIGMYVATIVPLVPYGADQARFLSIDNVTERNDAARYVDLRRVDDWLAAEF